MKKYIFLIIVSVLFFYSANAQYKKNGQPDMRYNANKGTSGYNYSTPSYSNSGYQNSYIKKNGTYVNGSYHSKRNKTNTDNYSTNGNYNPYTGKRGSRARDYSSQAQNYGEGHVIHRGLFGGRYYRNEYGKKIYVPKR